MAAGFVTGQQKADDPVATRIATHPHPRTTHSPYTCDNGGKWNHSRQRCDCPTGFEGKTGFSIT